jgi:photosystem II stability/assembly factor-like uncharacterized protein
MTGWASDGSAVLRTEDGGMTWVEVYRAPVDPRGGWLGILTCHGDDVAWLTLSDGAGAGHVAYAIVRTIDGGDHWDGVLQERNTAPLGRDAALSAAPGPYPGPVSIVSPETTFVFGRCGPCGEHGTLSLTATNDGGRTWRAPVTVPGVPFSDRLGVAFVSEHRGWLATTVDGRGRILVTDDAGLTWQQQWP